MITSSQSATKLRTGEKIGENHGLSKDTVARYLRIRKLFPALIDLLDEGKLAFLSAYQLSFVRSEIHQNKIAELVRGGCKINVKTAALLRKRYSDKRLSIEQIEPVVRSESTKPKPRTITLNNVDVSEYFNENQSKSEIEKTILKALKLYFNQGSKQQNQTRKPGNGKSKNA